MKEPTASPFVATHRRCSDGLQAMLLAEHGGNALYRVQWTDNGKRHRNTLVRDASVFADNYQRVRLRT